SRASLDGDGLGRADGFAQLAGDAALFPIGITTQRMLTAEARRHMTLFERVVDRRLGREEITHSQEERRNELAQQQRVEKLSGAHQAIPPCQPQPVSLRTKATMTTMISEIGRNTFQPIRISWS